MFKPFAGFFKNARPPFAVAEKTAARREGNLVSFKLETEASI
jgi:hypothetical protein